MCLLLLVTETPTLVILDTESQRCEPTSVVFTSEGATMLSCSIWRIGGGKLEVCKDKQDFEITFLLAAFFIAYEIAYETRNLLYLLFHLL